MSGGESVPLFTPEELAAIAVEVAEAQREADAYCEWLRSTEGRAWADQVLQEARAMAEEFERDCKVGKYALSPAELEQLRRDGIFVAHRKKEGSGHD